MNGLFHFPDAQKAHPEVASWLAGHRDDLGDIARRWFDVMRACGADVREVMHDGCPTACVDAAAFAYVGAFKTHVNVGFFRGAELADPRGLLEGTGKRMRHVKLRPESEPDERALRALIAAAYDDMKRRVAAA
jgi:hypothetical protein